MSWQLTLLMYVSVLVVLLLLGEWIVFALGIGGIFALLLSGGLNALNPLGSVIWNSLNNFTLTAIPLFILMGELILQSKMGERFYTGMSLIFRRVPGGLLHTNIVSAAIFSALTGVSVATAATIGTVAIPELTKHGYDRKMVFGSLAAGGTLGILIPPSIPMILYCVLAQQSIAKLFAAGILPGILIACFFLIYIAIRVMLNPGLAPAKVPQDDRPGMGFWGFTLSVFPIIGLIVMILGGIYFGVITPTEAAAVGAFLSLILYLLYTKFDLRTLKLVIGNTVRTSCMVLFIVVGAQIFSFALVYSGLNRLLVSWVVSFGDVQGTIFVLICIIYICLGFFFDPISILVLTMTILYPIIVQFNFDPIWFGVILVILIELGLITPPVGINLFVIHGISGKRSMAEVIAGVFPYIFILLFGILVLYIFPSIALFIPDMMQ